MIYGGTRLPVKPTVQKQTADQPVDSEGRPHTVEIMTFAAKQKMLF